MAETPRTKTVQVPIYARVGGVEVEMGTVTREVDIDLVHPFTD